MASFLQIRNRVSKIVIDLPATVQAEIPTLVNKALFKLQQRRNWKVMETHGGPYVTTSGSRVLAAVPVNFKALRPSKPFYLTALGQMVPLEGVASRSDAGFAFGQGTIDIGPPRLLLDTEPSDTGARNWEVFPMPDDNSDHVDGQYRIYVPYWRFLPDLSADGDTNWFTVHAEEFIIKQAAAEGFFYDWDEQRGTFWANLAGGELRDAVARDKQEMLAGFDTLVPHQGQYTPRVRL